MHKKFFPRFLIFGLIVIALAYITEIGHAIIKLIDNNITTAKFCTQSVLITLGYSICFVILFIIYKSEKKE